MGVSLECYRLRIGCYQPKYKIVRQCRVKSMKKIQVQTLSFHVVFILVSSIPMYFLNLSFDNIVQTSLWQSGLMGLNANATNQVCHSLNGNRKQQGLTVASWSCGRSVIQKIDDIKLFIKKHRPHLFAISEADLHGQNSLQFRRNTFTAEEIFESLEIDGYHVILPDTWQLFDQARIIVFASNNITVKMREIPV